MQEKPDVQLLRAYVDGDEAAFREIVSRHTDLVYSAALRQVNSPDLAQDIAQSVFVDLVRKAREVGERLTPGASLAGWLYRSTRFAVLNRLRDDSRRAKHERQAMEQLITDSSPAPDWERIRPILDEAMAELSDEDRDAVVLRYFKNHDFQTVGRAIGLSDDAAQKRVSRAVERLREFFSKRGMAIGASGLIVVVSANAVQAAPLALAASISTAAILTGSTTTTAIATKAIAMTFVQKTLVTATVAVALGAGVYEAHLSTQLHQQVRTLQQQQAPLAGQIQQLQRERDELANRLSASANDSAKGSSAELLALRAEVTRLRRDSQELAELKTNDPAQAELKSWLARLKRLKQEAQTNSGRIPEFSLLTEQDWLNEARLYGRRTQFDAQTDLRVAMAELRQDAQKIFAEFARDALIRYAKDHGGSFPTDLSQFQSYLPIAVEGVPVDDTILQRYEIAPAEKFGSKQPGQDWVITQKELVDDEYDHHIAIGVRDWSYDRSLVERLPPEALAAKRALDPALKEFSAANNGQQPTEPSQLQPYVKTDEQKAALQKLMELRYSNMPTNK
jgi:RNA polymerase sigma factor (sigma-70 family)